MASFKLKTKKGDPTTSRVYVEMDTASAFRMLAIKAKMTNNELLQTLMREYVKRHPDLGLKVEE